MDPLAPDRDAFWSAIDERLAAIEQGLTWLDLAQARQALHDFPGSLRLLGLAAIAELAERLWQGFQADPRHPDRLGELADLRRTVRQAQAAGGAIPIVEAAQKRCLLVVSGDATVAAWAKDQPGWRRIVARDTASALVWLRRGDIHAVLVDPDVPGNAAGWLAQVPADLPVAVTSGAAPLPAGQPLQPASREGLRRFLAGL